MGFYILVYYKPSPLQEVGEMNMPNEWVFLKSFIKQTGPDGVVEVD